MKELVLKLPTIINVSDEELTRVWGIRTLEELRADLDFFFLSLFFVVDLVTPLAFRHFAELFLR